MTKQINKRIVTVGIQSENDFQLFEGLDIRAYGQKFAGPESNTATIQISNLTRAQKNWLLTVATPWLPVGSIGIKPVLVTLSVGRENEFQPFLLFQGYCWASRVTMPPDIGVILESTVNNVQASTMQPQEFGALTDLGTIASQIAERYSLKLNNTASPKQIANFQYVGGLQTAINKLAKCGGVNVQCDHSTLSIYDIGSAIGNSSPFLLNASNGMVGIPEATQNGIKAMCLIRPEPQIGGPITIQSNINPAADGDYFINTMNYHVTNRDDPFWYELFCNYNNEES